MTVAAMPTSGSRRAVLIVVFSLLAAAGIGAYVLAAVLAEDRAYSKASLDYLILTPKVIRNLPLEQAEDIQFTYSAADGPKPAISTVEFVPTGDSGRAVEAIGANLRSQGLTEKAPGVFERSGQEVSLQPAAGDAAQRRVRVEVLDYLR